MFFWESTAAPGIRVAFTDRSAGNLSPRVGGDPDAALQARGELERHLGIARNSLNFMNQTHSTLVAEADADGPPEADALVSPTGRHALAVLVADCVPVVLVGRRGDGQPLTSVVHAGRKGVEGNIAGQAVARLKDHGAEAVTGWVGPSVCGRCYEVPADLREQVARAAPATHSTTTWGTPALDLPAGVREQLEGAGAAVQEFDAGSISCTLENSALFSHRAVQDGRPEGRMAGLVWFDG